MDKTDSISLAITRVSSCERALREVAESTRIMLESILVASQDSSEWVERLEAWNEGQSNIVLSREKVVDALNSIVDFMHDPHYPELSGSQQTDFFDTLKKAENNLVNFDQQLSFYRLLNCVEHTEQTVDFLWNKFESVKSYFFILRGNKELWARWLARHMNRCIRLRDRLCVEICNFMNLLEQVIENDAFETMDTERKELYHAKWRTYLQKCDQLSGK